MNSGVLQGISFSHIAVFLENLLCNSCSDKKYSSSSRYSRSNSKDSMSSRGSKNFEKNEMKGVFLMNKMAVSPNIMQRRMSFRSLIKAKDIAQADWRRGFTKVQRAPIEGIKSIVTSDHYS
jgi:hypothetical protein